MVYGGDLLEGFYDDWILALRERYRAGFFAALDDRLLTTRRACDPAAAQAYAQRILAADPWREDVVRSLMSIKYEIGDRTGALHAFEKFARRVHDEMDVAPMSDTLALRDAVLRGVLPLHGDVARDDRHAGSRGMFALVGRDRELQALRRMWERAARGHGGTVIISGEAGIGKTRLARELALVAQSQGARVLWGTTTPGEGRPYQGIAEALEQAAALLADVDLGRPWLDALTALVPALHDIAGAGTAPSIAPEREQHRLIDAVVRALLAIASSRPTVLFIEDVQWASTASSLAIERIAARAEETPLLVILTHRDEHISSTPFGRVRNRLGTGATVQRCPLGRLGHEAIRDLLNVAQPRESVTEEYLARVERLTAGNPLLVVSSLHAELGADAAELPGTQVLLQRYDGLSKEAMHVAEVAAVAGPRFGFDLIREAVGSSEHDVFDAIDALQDARIIEERPVAGTFEFRFTHELLCDSLYDRIQEKVRKRRHERIGRVLERLHPDEPRFAGEIASHYERAGDCMRAAPRFLQASEYAASVFAHSEARALAQRALQTESLGAREKCRALWAVAKACWRLGDLSAVRTALDELERSTGTDAQEKCRVLYRRCELEFAAGDRLARLHAIGELERVALKEGLQTWLLHARVERIHSDVYAGAPGALHAAQTQVESMEAGADPKAAVRLLCVCCTASATDLEGEAAAQYAAQAQAIAEASGDPILRSIALRSALSVAHQRQDFEHVRNLARQMVDLARAAGDSLLEATGYAYLANASYGLGDVESTGRAYAEALSRLEQAGDQANLMRAALNCAVFQCEEGFFEESRERALLARQIAHQASDHAIEHHATLVLATIEVESASWASARAILDILLDEENLDPQTRTGVLEESGRAAIGQGEYPRAIADLDSALHGFEALGQRWYSRRVRAELALAHSLAGDATRARALVAQLTAEDPAAEPAVFARRVKAALARIT